MSQMKLHSGTRLPYWDSTPGETIFREDIQIRVVIQACQGAAETDRHSFFFSSEKHKSTKDRLLWAIDYMPCINQVKHAVMKHWYLLQDIPGCCLSPMFAFCRMQNIFIKSDIRCKMSKCNLPKGHFRRGSCFVCPQAMEGATTDIPERGIHVSLKHFSTCCISNTVYLIKCASRFMSGAAHVLLRCIFWNTDRTLNRNCLKLLWLHTSWQKAIALMNFHLLFNTCLS